MEFIKASFNGDPNIGLYGFATDKYCLIGMEPNSIKKIKATLEVDVKVATIAETHFVGIFAAGNKNGIIVPKNIEDYELKRLKKMLDVKIEVIDSKHTALGNLVLCNDKGCLISSLLKDHAKQIEKCLGVDVEVATIAGTEIIGSAAKANNNGCVAHRDATEEELKLIERVLKVKADVGTISFGTPFIKAGVIVNNKGVIISEPSTGPEIDRCFEVFQ